MEPTHVRAEKVGEGSSIALWQFKLQHCRKQHTEWGCSCTTGESALLPAVLLPQRFKKAGFCLVGGHGLSKGKKDCFWILKISPNSSWWFLCFLGTPLPLFSSVSCWNDNVYWRPASALYFENTWLVSLYKWQLEQVRLSDLCLTWVKFRWVLGSEVWKVMLEAVKVEWVRK